MPAERPPCTDDDAMQRSPHSEAVGRGESLDVALSRQREDWQNGIRIPIAERLKAWEADCADPASAAELIYQDILLQRDFGAAPNWDSVLRGFPQYAAQLEHFREADEIVDGVLAHSSRSESILAGYDLLEEVGRGGMGVVYRAREHGLDRTVAVKRIRGGALADDATVLRFLKEAKAISRLNHPNIVHIYRVGDCDGGPFIALEFVEGPTLGGRIGATPLAPRLAGTICAAVARAVQHAHQHGIIHRDLKPANILLAAAADSPVPKVTDFGAAKELIHATESDRTQFLGTPSYMAPEQVEPEWGAIGPRTDVYGVGAVLYEALTGRPPFRADSVGETLRQVVDTEPVSPRLLNPAVPRDLETVCLKCLQKQPQHRYASAAALADDLGRFLDGEPIHARPIGPAARTWMWCRRKPGTASLVAVLLLALLGGITGIAFQWRSAEAARRIALASDVEAQELLGELIHSNLVVPNLGYRPIAPSIESLLKAETHCTNLLRRNPDEITLRIALTKVHGCLGTFYAQRAQMDKAEASFREAQGLWERLPSTMAGNPDCRDWLATTYSWQGRDDPQRSLQSCQRAEAIWEQLDEEQPGSPDLMQKIWECRSQITSRLSLVSFNGDCGRLEEERRELERLVAENPADRPLRKRLALTCFALGEIYFQDSSADKASSSWRESYENYNMLARGSRDDLLGNIALAISCSRLIQGQPTDPYYRQALPLLERSGRRLDELLKQQPQSTWLRGLLVEDYCCLVLCHTKAGQTAKAEQVCHDHVFRLTPPLDTERVEPEFALDHATTLVAIGTLLREAKQPAASLRLVRQAAVLCSQLAAYPSHDLTFLDNLGHTQIHCSSLANQLGEPTLSLQLAELGRRTIEGLIRTAPDGVRHNGALSAAWERIAKARWSLGERDQALVAFRELTAIDKRLFEQEPSNRLYRASLSRCYDKLAHYSSNTGDLRAAAAALLEREKLWLDNAQQLAKTADEFNLLANRVTARGRGPLSSEDKGEHDHYLAESRRLRLAAEAATGRAGHDLRVER